VQRWPGGLSGLDRKHRTGSFLGRKHRTGPFTERGHSEGSSIPLTTTQSTPFFQWMVSNGLPRQVLHSAPIDRTSGAHLSGHPLFAKVPDKLPRPTGCAAGLDPSFAPNLQVATNPAEADISGQRARPVASWLGCTLFCQPQDTQGKQCGQEDKLPDARWSSRVCGGGCDKTLEQAIT
jgi:hypothetical protein